MVWVTSNKNKMVFTEFNLDESTDPRNCYYTVPSFLRQVGNEIFKYMKQIPEEKKPVFIDFSAGDDTLGIYLRTKGIDVVSYDINPKSDTVIKQDWLETDPTQFENRACVIGFNPPFGPGGKFARQFLEHAMRYFPLRIYCILGRVVQKVPFDDYKRVHSELLPRRKMFIDSTTGEYTSEQPGLFFVVYEYEAGYRKPVKRSREWPDAFKPIYGSKTWYVPNTVFIRKQGYAPGTQLLYCTPGDNPRLILLKSKTGSWIEDPKDHQINNHIANYMGFQLNPEWKWNDSVEVWMESIREKCLGLDFRRSKTRYPSFRKKHLIDILQDAPIESIQQLPRKRQRLVTLEEQNNEDPIEVEVEE